MLPADYPQDILECIVDYAALDMRTISRLGLVCKSFLTRARYLGFRDLTVHVCGDPGHRCNTSHCLILLSQLLCSSHCTIPRTLVRLVLTARGPADVIHFYRSRPFNHSESSSVASHVGGMDDPSVVLPVLKHFHDVYRLELVDVDWFTFPSWSASRVTAKFFSSIRHLVIDGPKFCSGPEALFSIIHRSSHLESLSILGASWPACGPDGLTVSNMNASRASALFSPVYLHWKAMYKIKQRQPTRRYSLPKTLQQLALDCGVKSVFISWLLQQVELTNVQLSSLELRPARQRCESQDLQRVLDVLPTVTHLTVPWQRFEPEVPPVPSLSLHRGLRTLVFQLRAAHHITWEACVAWVRAALRTVTSEFLATLILDIVIPVDELVRACQLKPKAGVSVDPVFEQDVPGMGILRSLQKVDVRVNVVMDWYWTAPRHGDSWATWPAPERNGGWATWPERCGPLLFPICDRKGLLHMHIQDQPPLS
ncbi:hypothetical protein B0H16DRAFT_1540218 [Mycena metata]|uniref:Uncharacterized protein n=1 Tax=Mycena metata TaxID=1033252 RepID=A0AAD7J390_9AGAR|nr:hypothetical protein B0H16DRAFT_1540218 [Mycena metata]